MSKAAGTEWKTLTRDDLKVFSDAAKDIVLEAMSLGGLGRISSNGHAILRGPNGETMPLGRNSGTGHKGMTAVRRDFNRVFGPLKEEAEHVGDAVAEVPASDELAAFPKKVQDMIRAAIELGWTQRWSGKTLVLYGHESKQIHLNPRWKFTRDTILKHERTIAQYGDPLRVASSQAIFEYPLGTLSTKAEIAEALESAGLKVTRGSHGEDKPEPEEPSESRTDAPSKKTLVSREPFLAHATHGTGGKPGQRYRSLAVLERHWSDESVDFECAVEGCDYSGDSPRSVTSHRKIHINRGEITVEERGSYKQRVIDDPTYTEPIGPSRPGGTREYRPRADRVESLSEQLTGLLERLAMEGLTGYPEGRERAAKDIAEAALRWVHEQHRDGESIGEEPTAEELLDRIRRLVDRGEYVNLRAKLDEQGQALAEARAEIAAAQADADRCRIRSQELEDSLSTLHELTGGLILRPTDETEGD